MSICTNVSTANASGKARASTASALRGKWRMMIALWMRVPKTS